LSTADTEEILGIKLKTTLQTNCQKGLRFISPKGIALTNIQTWAHRSYKLSERSKAMSDL
jgi:hypothetical protein